MEGVKTPPVLGIVADEPGSVAASSGVLTCGLRPAAEFRQMRERVPMRVTGENASCSASGHLSVLLQPFARGVQAPC